MLHNYLLKTTKLLLLFCTCSLIFSACGKSVEIPPVIELTVEDKRNIANRILDIITVNENYEILDRDEYAEAYEYLDNHINFITDSELLTHRTSYNWKVHIIDDEGTNAFTTPGGYIYFDKGLLEAIGSEATFMHLLANEIAYADKGFVSQKLQNNFGLQLLLDLALDSTVETAEELLNTLYNKPFDQNSAKEADDFMLELACEKGYDAGSLHWFLTNTPITWLDLHPNGELDARLGAINAYECTLLDSMSVSIDTYGDFLSKL